MLKKTSVARTPGPMEDIGLEAPDQGKNIEQSAISLGKDGPDSPLTGEYDLFKPYGVREQSMSPKEIAEQLAREQKIRDGVTVIMGPTRIGNLPENRMSNPIYSKIVAKLNRSAEDVPTQTGEEVAAPSDQPYQTSTTPAVPSGSTPEYEAGVAQKEKEAREQLEKDQAARKEKIDAEKPDPRATTRQKGYEKDVSGLPLLKLKPGDKDYDAALEAFSKYMEAIDRALNDSNSYITQESIALRQAAVLNEAYAAASETVEEFSKSLQHQMSLILHQLRETFRLSNKISTIKLTPGLNAFKSKRISTRKLNWAAVFAGITNPASLAADIKRLREIPEPLKEGPQRAEAILTMTDSEEGRDLLALGVEAFLKTIKELTTNAASVQAVLTGMIPIYVKGGRQLKKKAALIKARAEKHNVNIVKVAKRYEISGAEIAEKQKKLQKVIDMMTMLEAAGDKLEAMEKPSTTASGSSALSVSSAVMEAPTEAPVAAGWSELLAQIDELEFEASTIFDDIEAFQDTAEVARALEDFNLDQNRYIKLASTLLQQVNTTDSLADQVSSVPVEAAIRNMGNIISRIAAEKRENKPKAQKPMPGKISDDLTEGLSRMETKPSTKKELATPYVTEEGIKVPEKERAQALAAEERLKAKEKKGLEGPALENKKKEWGQNFAREFFMAGKGGALPAGYDPQQIKLAKEKAFEATRILKESKDKALAGLNKATADASVDTDKDWIAAIAKDYKDAGEWAEKLWKILNEKSKDSKLEKALVEIDDKNGPLAQFCVDASEEGYSQFLQNKDIADVWEWAFPTLLAKVKQRMPMEKYGKGIEAVNSFARNMGEVTYEIQAVLASRAPGGFKGGKKQPGKTEIPANVRQMVEEQLRPGLEKAEKEVVQQTPYTMEAATEKPISEQAPYTPPAPGAKSSFDIFNETLSRIALAETDEAAAQAVDVDLKALSEKIKALNASAAEVEKFLTEGVDDIIALASDKDYNKAADMILKSIEDYKKEGEKEDGFNWREELDKVKQYFSAPEPAMATASKEDVMERTAGEFDKFDVSLNKLEIIEGENGKRKLVINKGLKSLVSQRVHERLTGGFKCGDSVQVDFSDYVGFGTVKAYIGQSVYRVEVDGVVMEVPAKNVMGLDGNPWK